MLTAEMLFTMQLSCNYLVGRSAAETSSAPEQAPTLSYISLHCVTSLTICSSTSTHLVRPALHDVLDHVQRALDHLAPDRAESICY